MLRAGLPDEAFDVLTGDDKAVAKAYKAINKKQRDGKGASGIFEEMRAPASISDGAAKVLAMPEDTLEEIEAKSRAWIRLLNAPNWLTLKAACDMYVAAFLLPKKGDAPDPRHTGHLPLPTTDAIWRTVRGDDTQSDMQIECIAAAEANRVFHWPLEFPAVMACGGFDAVVGNPPWERIKLQEQEFFAARDTDIATAANKAERQELINALKRAEAGTPRAHLLEEFELAKRASEAASVFVRKSGRFPLTGTGDVNTYALFAEHSSRLARDTGKGEPAKSLVQVITDPGGVRLPPPGRAGVIVPTGIATDMSTSAFFGDLVARSRLAALYSFYEVRRWFKDTDERKPFCIFVVARHKGAIPVIFNIQDIDEVYRNEREVLLSVDDFKFFNPNTLTTPLFGARADRDLTRKLYSAAPVLVREGEQPTENRRSPWGITFQTLFHMSNDSSHFRTTRQLSEQNFCRDGVNWQHQDGRTYVPLYEAKMIHHFDHRFGSYTGLNSRPADGSLPEMPDRIKTDPNYESDPWYWVPEVETALRVARVPSRLKHYYRKENAVGCLKVLAEWVLGTLESGELESDKLALTMPVAEARICDVLGERALQREIVGAKIATWLGKVAAGTRKMQRETPLTDNDIVFIQEASADPLELTGALIDHKRPRWLMGWRRNARSADERTWVVGVFPPYGVGDSIFLLHSSTANQYTPALLACASSLVTDFISRQKIVGTNLSFYYIEQIPIVAPGSFSIKDHAFITPRVLELTYTSRSMQAWAEDLGHTGAPFAFDPDRRAQLRAELDAFIAHKYGLSRDELRYILDPADIHGARPRTHKIIVVESES